MARREVIDAAIVERIVGGIERGLSFDDAAAAAGVSAETFRRFRRRSEAAQRAAVAARSRRERRRAAEIDKAIDLQKQDTIRGNA
jgi:hypothetical protein